MNGNYRDRLARFETALENADRVLIGGGAGLSTAAGIDYGAARFASEFPDFREKYGMADMYSAGFYPFASQEEKWAYWSRHVKLNRFDPPALPLYLAIRRAVADKKYFVITTNVDAQFFKAGFGRENIFAVQGDYGMLQCASPCCDKLYYNEKTISEMAAAQKDCKIPSALIPKCPVCGGRMEVNIRKDHRFVENDEWRAANARFESFLNASKGTKLLLLEIGVGFNTPSIIRFPFEAVTAREPFATLVRINKDYPEAIEENAKKSLSFAENPTKIFADLAKNRGF